MVDAASQGHARHHVGTLSYTRRGLVVLFAWMLWGDFCFTLMETIVPNIMPIKLKALGASNSTMALILSTLPGVLNTTICPWVSFWSDRYRSRWGRRIPFIVTTLPFLTMFLILMGYSDQIGNVIHRWAFAANGLFSVTTVSVVLIGIFMVGFQFFNMFVGSVYYYLFNDVVPKEFIGQFLGLFRAVGGLAGVFFNYFIFKYAESHMSEIFLGVSLLYAVGFGLMCLFVREGEYPPPPENVGQSKGLLAGVKTFFVECFSLRFYWYIFGMTTFWTMTGSASIFSIFRLRDVGLTLEQIGTLTAIGGTIGLLLTYPAGFVADKYHPLRVQLAMKAIILLFTPMGLIFLFVEMSPRAAYYYLLLTSLAAMPAAILYGAAEFPTLMRLLPQERFGQFCSANAMVRSVGTIIGGIIAGLTFDALKWAYGGNDFSYRWLPAWQWIFQILAVICLIKVHSEWKRLGGMHNYVPPLPESSRIANAPALVGAEAEQGG